VDLSRLFERRNIEIMYLLHDIGKLNSDLIVTLKKSNANNKNDDRTCGKQNIFASGDNKKEVNV